MSVEFYIDGKRFSAQLETDVFIVKSSPRPYQVVFVDTFEEVKKRIALAKYPLILIDSNLSDTFEMEGVPTFKINALESNKNISTALNIVCFLMGKKADKGSDLFVIGGGITQDLGAFACAMYKRGIPWTFVPTTVLSQADSCVGGKTALNYKGTKNVLALFSAPSKVIICEQFRNTLTPLDVLSGMGEAFRLSITGGKFVLDTFFNAETGDSTIVKNSLSIKKTIVEEDEFEKDIRRSMNYGHSIGHALEGATEYAIPHGLAVTLGILMENSFAKKQGLLSSDIEEYIFCMGKTLLPFDIGNTIKDLQVTTILEFMKQDKKIVGGVLKMPVLRNYGSMEILNFGFTPEIENSFISAIENIKGKLYE